MTEREFAKKYIRPWIWSGDLYVDGGWGPKNAIQEAICTEDPMSGSMLEPFFCKPVADSCPRQTVSDGSRHQTSNKANLRYSATFPGEYFSVVLQKIKEVDRIAEEGQKWILHSHRDGEDGPLYRLVIDKPKGGRTYFRVLRGKLIPSFESPIICAEW